jgi:hypothetical protein
MQNPAFANTYKGQDFSASRFDFRRPNEIVKINGGTTNFTYGLIFADPQAHHSSGQVQDEPTYLIRYSQIRCRVRDQ